MAENKINYLNRDYNEIRQNILDITRKYYPDVFGNIDDASIGAWLIDIISDTCDALNFHIDRVFNETDLNSANELSSLMNIARTNGLRIPGKKSALCEIEISCQIPLQASETRGKQSVADEKYCPYIKRGMLVSDGMYTFELIHDVNFAQQFDENGISNRQIIPSRDSNGNIIGYTYKKLAVVVAGQSKIFKQVITNSDIKPFMEITLQDSDILGVESIIVKEGKNLNTDPLISDFYVDEETYWDKSGKPVQRFFEVENLIDQYRFGYEDKFMNEEGDKEKPWYKTYQPVWYKLFETGLEGSNEVKDAYGAVVKGKWKRLKNKFITEYTDNWNLKVIFGAGLRNEYGTIPDNATDFTKYMMSRMEANDYMGVLPDADKTLFILYRVGGGEQTNIAKDTLTNIIYKNMSINCEDGQKRRDVENSLKVTNTTPSYGGKDEPSNEEIRYMLKYNNSAQNRCVTLKDYYVMINKIPAKYGCPFRIGVVEENNKVVIYTLGLDYNGKLMSMLSETVADNIKEYLSMYKAINDFIEIKSGKIVNLGFNLTVYIDKTYDKSEVTKRIIDTVYDYMDIKRHLMGEEIFLGDLQKEVSKLDGVINLVDLKCYNKTGEGYSNDKITQELVNTADSCYLTDVDGLPDGEQMIDLKSSDYILFSECNSMFEIKYKESDIIVNVKTR